MNVSKLPCPNNRIPHFVYFTFTSCISWIPTGLVFMLDKVNAQCQCVFHHSPTISACRASVLSMVDVCSPPFGLAPQPSTPLWIIMMDNQLEMTHNHHNSRPLEWVSLNFIKQAKCCFCCMPTHWASKRLTLVNKLISRLFLSWRVYQPPNSHTIVRVKLRQ